MKGPASRWRSPPAFLVKVGEGVDEGEAEERGVDVRIALISGALSVECSHSMVWGDPPPILSILRTNVHRSLRELALNLFHTVRIENTRRKRDARSPGYL